MWLANELDAEVLYGDGTEVEVLIKRERREADCFIAVTGQDQDNLVASPVSEKTVPCTQGDYQGQRS